MFNCLIDNLNPDKWQEIDMASKNEAEFKEYHVVRHNHKFISDTVLGVMVAEEDSDAKNVAIKDVAAQKDPLKSIGLIELKLNADGTEIIGMDLNGDIVVRK